MVRTNNSSDMSSAKDKYYESIDFSNSCRQFYLRRLKLADDMKEKMKKPASLARKENGEKSSERKTSIDSAMEKLRSEMASLMDQDLSLMKQLLTLNETIEELKQKRLYGVSKDSLGETCFDLSSSEGSVSETDMYITEDDEQTFSIKDGRSDINSDFEETKIKNHSC